MRDDDLPQPLTPDDLLGEPEEDRVGGPQEKRARDMATMAALLGLVLVAGGLMAILALVLNQLLVFAILAVLVLGGFYLALHYLVWGRRLDRQIASESRPPETWPESVSQAQHPPSDPAIDAGGESQQGT